MTTAEQPHESVSYQIFMLVLSLFALRTIAVQVTLKRDPEVENILGYADYLICTFFFIDFLLSLWYGPNRWRYGSTWGWLDLRRFQCWMPHVGVVWRASFAYPACGVPLTFLPGQCCGTAPKTRPSL
jgi:hypothetical protein